MIAEGDFDRLTFCDGPGSAPHPYSRGFLKEIRGAFYYDRFWERQPDDCEKWMNTRYGCCGYNFLAIGAYWIDPANPKKRGFFNDARGGILLHFRHHYFKMGLIAHFHRVALLKFADDLAEAIKDLAENDMAEGAQNLPMTQKATRIQMGFLKFRSRAYFTEVTNQVQGQELYELWEKHLGVRNFFQQVDEGSQRLFEALSIREQKAMMDEQVKMVSQQALTAVVGEILTKVVVFVGVLTMVFTFVAHLEYVDKTQCQNLIFLAEGLISAFLIWFTLLFVNRPRDRKR